MKNFFGLVVFVVFALMVSCNQKPVEVFDPIPADTDEWTVELTSPVLPELQKVQSHYLPQEVYEIFESKIQRINGSIAVPIIRANELPVNACSHGYTAEFIYVNLNDDVSSGWNGQTDPKDFMYIIKCKDYRDIYVALWFDGPNSLHCKKLVLPNKENYSRPEKIALESFDQAVEWEWTFTGVAHECSEYAKGEVVEYQAQYGRTFVTTKWEGGEEYTLPRANTRIEVNGRTLYCE